MQFKKDLRGNKFGRWTVLQVEPECRNRRSYWAVQCECGNLGVIRGSALTSSKSLSCGCYMAEECAKRNRKHGYFGTRTYESWAQMRKRCLSPQNRAYPSYGGRGITVCKRWGKFENFLKDMGEKPEGRTLGRIDNDAGYSPKNCRWETPKEQQRNRRSVKILKLNGVGVNLPECAERTGLKASTLRARVEKGVSNIFAPVRRARLYRIDSQEKTLTEWCVHFGVKNVTVRRRLRAGWAIADAFKPVARQKQTNSL